MADAGHSKDGTDLIVRFDGVTIPPDMRNALAHEIQALTLRELAKLDLGAGIGVRVPRKEWLGIWIERFGQGELPTLRVTQGR